MRSQDGFTVGGAGEPGAAGADAVEPVVSTESVPCVGLLEGVGWETAVVTAGASAEPAPTSVGTAKGNPRSQRRSPQPRHKFGDGGKRFKRRHLLRYSPLGYW